MSCKGQQIPKISVHEVIIINLKTSSDCILLLYVEESGRIHNI
jgi:hypothetical protein